MKSKLTRVAAKIKHFNGKMYCGYLTSAETVYLYESFFINYRSKDDWSLDYAQESKEKGQSNPTWQYFELKPNTELTEIMVRKHN